MNNVFDIRVNMRCEPWRRGLHIGAVADVMVRTANGRYVCFPLNLVRNGLVGSLAPIEFPPGAEDLPKEPITQAVLTEYDFVERAYFESQRSARIKETNQ